MFYRDTQEYPSENLAQNCPRSGAEVIPTRMVETITMGLLWDCLTAWGANPMVLSKVQSLQRPAQLPLALYFTAGSSTFLGAPNFFIIVFSDRV